MQGVTEATSQVSQFYKQSTNSDTLHEKLDPRSSKPSLPAPAVQCHDAHQEGWRKEAKETIQIDHIGLQDGKASDKQGVCGKTDDKLEDSHPGCGKIQSKVHNKPTGMKQCEEGNRNERGNKNDLFILLIQVQNQTLQRNQQSTQRLQAITLKKNINDEEKSPEDAMLPLSRPISTH